LSDFLLLNVFIGAVVMLLLSEGYYPSTVFVSTVVHSNTPHGTEEEVSQAQGNSNKEDGSLEGVVDGELEVNLNDLGVSVEDIAAFQRIEARLAKAS
jgi:hypothetical protein